jgi:hypothetical protein
MGFRASRSSADSVRVWPAWCRRRYRRDTSIYAASSGEHRSPSRSARSSLWARGSWQRGPRRPGARSVRLGHSNIFQASPPRQARYMSATRAAVPARRSV